MLVGLLLKRELRPGDKLPTEPDLATMLGVGRNSVREALKMLGSFGVVEVKRGVGTFISKALSPTAFNPLILSLIYNQDQQKEFLELRYFFEVAAVDLAMSRLDEDILNELNKINAVIFEEASKKSIDNNKVRELDFDFHSVLLEATKNPFFIRLGQAIYKLFYSSIGSITFDEAEQTYKNHVKIIEAIESKDASSIRASIWESLIFWLDYIGEENTDKADEVTAK